MDWILDVAHNPAGAWALRSGLRDSEDGRRLGTLVFSCLRDKPIGEIAQILFPLFSKVIFAPIQSARATPMRDLLDAAAATQTPALAAGTSAAGAGDGAGKGPLASLLWSPVPVYLVGEVRSCICWPRRHRRARVVGGRG